MIKGFECARTQFFVNLHGAWRTQENVCAHKNCSGAHRRAQKVVAAPEISGRFDSFQSGLLEQQFLGSNMVDSSHLGNLSRYHNIFLITFIFQDSTYPILGQSHLWM